MGRLISYQIEQVDGYTRATERAQSGRHGLSRPLSSVYSTDVDVFTGMLRDIAFYALDKAASFEFNPWAGVLGQCAKMLKTHRPIFNAELGAKYDKIITLLEELEPDETEARAAT